MSTTKYHSQGTNKHQGYNQQPPNIKPNHHKHDYVVSMQNMYLHTDDTIIITIIATALNSHPHETSSLKPFPTMSSNRRQLVYLSPSKSNFEKHM